MIRIVFCLFLFFLSLFCNSQDYDTIVTNTDTVFAANESQILHLYNNKNELPDGEWVVFYENTTAIKFNFHLVNSCVHGYFRFLSNAGYLNISGKYFNDSLWTFHNHNSDTSFKIGTWFYNLPLVDKIRVYKHHMNFNDNIFIDEIIGTSRHIWFKRIWHIEKGLLSQVIFFPKNGFIESEQSQVNDSTVLTKVWDIEQNLVLRCWDYPSYRKVYYFQTIRTEDFWGKKGISNSEYYFYYHEKLPRTITQYNHSIGLIYLVKNFYSNGNISKETYFYYKNKYTRVILYYKTNGYLEKINFFKNEKLIKEYIF